MDFAKPIYVLVDRLALSPEIRSRLMDSIEICYREGGGEAILEFVPDAPGGLPAAREACRLRRNVSSSTNASNCKKCGAVYQEPEPRLFSFNSPYGACPRCQGFGNTIDFDLDRVIPDKSKSLADGAIEPWTKPRYRQLAMDMRRYARTKGIPLDVPFRQLSAAQRDAIIDGDPKEEYAGVKGFFGWLERKKYKLHVRVFLSRYRGYAPCPDCHGTRLRAEARAVKIGGRSITEVCQMTVKEARPFFERADAQLRRNRRSPTKFLKKFSCACNFSTKWASITSRSTGSPRRFPAARRNAFSSRRRSARIWLARSTCWTSLRSVCIRATPTA